MEGVRATTTAARPDTARGACWPAPAGVAPLQLAAEGGRLGESGVGGCCTGVLAVVGGPPVSAHHSGG